MNVLFVCEYSPQIGFGHLSRCKNLSISLTEDKSIRTFIIYQSDGNSNPEFFSNFAQSERASISELKDFCANWEIDLIICDLSHDSSPDELSIFSSLEIPFITIDDLSPRRLISNANFYPPIKQARQMDWTGFAGKNYIGWPYYVLSPNLKKFLNRKGDKEKLFISFGGSDLHKFIEKLQKTIIDLSNEYEIDLIIGPLTEYVEEDIKSKFPKNICIHYNPKNLFKIMSESQYALVTYGVTVFELAFLRIPSIVITTKDDHRISGECFWGEYNSFSHISYPSENIEDQIYEKIEELKTTKKYEFPYFGESANQEIIDIIKEI